MLGIAGSIGGGVFPFLRLMQRTEDSDTVPKAYLNYIVFDQRDTLVDFGYIRVNQDAYENGANSDHQHLFHDLVIRQPGYVYIYLSNENETPVDVFFDDFSVEHVKSPVVQMDDYYPFGLTYNSYSRENSLRQNFSFVGKEKQDEMGLDWLDFGARMYQPEIARWQSIDKKADSYVTTSPFVYAINNPIIFFDPDGNDVKPLNKSAYRAILNTLTAEDASHVKLNWRGRISKKIMNRHQSESGNFQSLKSLVNDDRTTEVAVSNSFRTRSRDRYEFGKVFVDKVNGPYFADGQAPSTGEVGYLGQTIYPDDGEMRSSNNNTQVYINEALSEQGRAEVLAHELYGHVALHMKGKYSRHLFQKEYDIDVDGKEGEVIKIKDLNSALAREIINRVNEAIKNYNERQKKEDENK